MEILSGRFVMDVLPELAVDLMELLTEAGEQRLAATLPDLSFHSWCECGEASCLSFYTAQPPDGPYGPGHYTLSLSRRHQMLVLDVVEDRIVFVEVLERLPRE